MFFENEIMQLIQNSDPAFRCGEGNTILNPDTLPPSLHPLFQLTLPFQQLRAFNMIFLFYFQHLMKPNYDVVKRWVNEAQEAVSSDNTMVQV